VLLFEVIPGTPRELRPADAPLPSSVTAIGQRILLHECYSVLCPSKPVLEETDFEVRESTAV
jgi:hypothetical protein